jgi:hypothetical protein
MVPVSLCVLTHDNADGLYRLIDSVKAFQGLEVEVIIGDNSSDPREQAIIRAVADEYFCVTDLDLWEDGFGPTKQKVVNMAHTEWAVVADPDEIWNPIAQPTGWAHLTLLGGSSGVFRTAMPEENGHGKRYTYHGRVFRRKDYRIIGLIHEEVFSKRDRKSWNEVAPVQPFCAIDHRPDECSEVYLRRKRNLYDQLILRAGNQRDAHSGTSRWWFETYLPRRIAEGLRPMTFEEWQEG